MSERERIIEAAAELLRGAFPDVPVDMAVLGRAADALGHGKEETPRLACGGCGRDVSHLIDHARARYGGCPWCGSFATRPA
jgi:hypothetical protein